MSSAISHRVNRTGGHISPRSRVGRRAADGRARSPAHLSGVDTRARADRGSAEGRKVAGSITFPPFNGFPVSGHIAGPTKRRMTTHPSPVRRAVAIRRRSPPQADGVVARRSRRGRTPRNRHCPVDASPTPLGPDRFRRPARRPPAGPTGRFLGCSPTSGPSGGTAGTPRPARPRVSVACCRSWPAPTRATRPGSPRPG